jgi:NAD(P)H-dependent FMN reductase
MSNTDLTLKVIVVSTRPGRQGRVIGDWFSEYAEQLSQFRTVELVDLVDVNLPLFDEPNHPMKGEYLHDHTKAWSQTIADADAFVFILPEYNYFPPATIINAIDYLHHEWKYKVAGIVSYGGVSAGTRSAQALKPLLANVGVMPIAEGVFLPFFSQFIIDGAFEADDTHRAASDKLLTQLQTWATALKPLH